MNKFVEVKTSALVGPALDWAVAKVAGHPADWEQSSGCLWFESEDLEWLIYSPSTDWAQGGPLIDEYDVWLSENEGACVASCPPHAEWFVVEGGTNLVAACRAIVTARLGSVVQVPVELVGVEQ